MTYKFEPACNRMEWLDPFYKQVWQKAFDDAIPISGTFELTPRCNFNCKMCYVHLLEKDIPKYGKELSAKKWIDIAKQAKEAGTTWLCITGGEPLLHPEFEEIYTQLSKMGFFITLQTNASLIPKYQKLFENYPPRSIKITLYGSNNETYKKVCQIDNGFTKVHQSIQLLKKMNIPIQLVSTITKQNLDDIKKMAFYAYINQLPWTSTGGIKNSFRNEKEVRIVSLPFALQTFLGNPNYRMESWGIREYYKIKIIEKIDDLIGEIIIGPKANVTVDTVQRYLQSLSNDYTKIKVKKSECPLR